MPASSPPEPERRQDLDRVRGPEEGLQAARDALEHLRELGAAVVDHLARAGLADRVGQAGGTGDAQVRLEAAHGISWARSRVAGGRGHATRRFGPMGPGASPATARYPLGMIPTRRTFALLLALVALVGACSGGAAATAADAHDRRDHHRRDAVRAGRLRLRGRRPRAVPGAEHREAGPRVLRRDGGGPDDARDRDAGGPLAHDHANSVSVEPGQTKTLELTFARAGTLEVGCHVPGHWDAGMRGTITVR